MFISMANLVINVVLNLILIRLWGVNGLALATSLSAVITFFIRLAATRKYIKLDNKRMGITALKALLGSVIACLIPRAIFWMYPINRYAVLLISALSAILLYFGVLKLLKITELDDLFSLVKKKTGR
jgi:putative peptidoglycan lipid II flippase